FFQAEDGIRDFHVTGVQTCALPIYVGCAKGFMLHDLALLIPGITVQGIDISPYAIEHAVADMKSHVQVADAKALPFSDKSFDVEIEERRVGKECRCRW